jgi:hypothetical protein
MPFSPPIVYTPCTSSGPRPARRVMFCISCVMALDRVRRAAYVHTCIRDDQVPTLFQTSRQNEGRHPRSRPRPTPIIASTLRHNTYFTAVLFVMISNHSQDVHPSYPGRGSRDHLPAGRHSRACEQQTWPGTHVCYQQCIYLPAPPSLKASDCVDSERHHRRALPRVPPTQPSHHSCSRRSNRIQHDTVRSRRMRKSRDRRNNTCRSPTYADDHERAQYAACTRKAQDPIIRRLLLHCGSAPTRHSRTPPSAKRAFDPFDVFLIASASPSHRDEISRALVLSERDRQSVLRDSRERRHVPYRMQLPVSANCSTVSETRRVPGCRALVQPDSSRSGDPVAPLTKQSLPLIWLLPFRCERLVRTACCHRVCTFPDTLSDWLETTPADLASRAVIPRTRRTAVVQESPLLSTPFHCKLATTQSACRPTRRQEVAKRNRRSARVHAPAGLGDCTRCREKTGFDTNDAASSAMASRYGGSSRPHIADA